MRKEISGKNEEINKLKIENENSKQFISDLEKEKVSQSDLFRII